MRRTYAAFISYSHGADSALAAALQTGLHRFAKPWWKPRAITVFRDKTNLSANPALWPTIVQALESSRWLVLLASPESAASPYVRQEVGWWREHRGAGHAILCLTGGEIAWDAASGDFDWRRSSALDPAFAGLFRAEPLWVDLRPFTTPATQRLSDEAFRDAVADIAAPLRNIPKHLLIDKDREEHRKLQLAGATLAAIIVLLSYGLYRIEQISRERKDTVVSHELAGRAYLNLPTDAELSALLALAGYARRQTGLAETALRHALSRLAPPAQAVETGPVREARPADGREKALAVLPGADRATAAALHRGGRLAALGDAAGSVKLYALSGGEPLASLQREAAVTALAFNPRGRSVLSEDLLASGDAHGNLHVEDVAPLVRDLRPAAVSGIQLPTEPGGIAGLAFTANGKCLAVAGRSGQLTLREVNSWNTLATLEPAGDAVEALVVEGSERFLLRLADGRAGRVRRYATPLCADKAELCSYADTLLKRAITAEERRRFVPGSKESDDEEPLPASCEALVARVLDGRR